VVVVRVWPVATCVTVTLEPGMTCPRLSTTVPLREASVSYARLVVGTRPRATTRETTIRSVREERFAMCPANFRELRRRDK
jgi:hypothetical protein